MSPCSACARSSWPSTVASSLQSRLVSQTARAARAAGQRAQAPGAWLASAAGRMSVCTARARGRLLGGAPDPTHPLPISVSARDSMCLTISDALPRLEPLAVTAGTNAPPGLHHARPSLIHGNARTSCAEPPHLPVPCATACWQSSTFVQAARAPPIALRGGAHRRWCGRRRRSSAPGRRRPAAAGSSGRAAPGAARSRSPARGTRRVGLRRGARARRRCLATPPRQVHPAHRAVSGRRSRRARQRRRRPWLCINSARARALAP